MLGTHYKKLSCGTNLSCCCVYTAKYFTTLSLCKIYYDLKHIEPLSEVSDKSVRGYSGFPLTTGHTENNLMSLEVFAS